MAEKAARRQQEHDRVQQALYEMEQRDELEREEQERIADYREGPPGGCHQCYYWGQFVYGNWGWFHGATVTPGPCPDPYLLHHRGDPDEWWCHHECHGGEPAFTGPVVIA